VFRWKVLEFDSGANLDRSRRTYPAFPGAKAVRTASSYVINEGETRALVIDVCGRIEVMLVNALKNAKRIWKFPRSPILVFFVSEISTFFPCGPRRFAMRGPSPVNP